MNPTTSCKSLILATALVLGLTTAARADDPLPLPGEQAVPVTESSGLLGQVYGTLTYSYLNLDDTSTHADSFNFEVSQPMTFGLDGFLGYNYTRSGAFGGSRLKAHVIDGGLRAFNTHYNWGKPYVEAGVGYAWTRYAGSKDNSFVWEVAVGAEIPVAIDTTLTPYIQYADAPDLGTDGSWNFGVKANYWVRTQWALTGGIEVDDNQNTAFTIGTNFRY